MTCDWLALAEPDNDLRTDSRLRPFRNRSKLSRTRAAALAFAFAAFFSTTFLARDGLGRCVVKESERERACLLVGSSGSRLCF
jgi:hypothetical protein